MAEGARDEARRWQLLGHVLLSAAVVVVLLWWAFWSFLLLVFTCDESCSGDDATHWRYWAQAVVAGIGIVAGLTGVAVGLSRREVFWAGLVVAGIFGLTWCQWVIGSGTF